MAQGPGRCQGKLRYGSHELWVLGRPARSQDSTGRQCRGRAHLRPAVALPTGWLWLALRGAPFVLLPILSHREPMPSGAMAQDKTLSLESAELLPPASCPGPVDSPFGLGGLPRPPPPCVRRRGRRVR